MKYFVLAGEASGDKQAALLCAAIKDQDASANVQGWGGDDMIATGVRVTKHYSELAFMGFVEVVKHLPAIFRNLRSCKSEILSFKPDALILVDYPGFNLRIASWAAKHNFLVYYYISPQLWAWHTSRVYNIKKAVRKMYVILPFEKEFYAGYGVSAMYIGHPLAMKHNVPEKESDHPGRKNIALLPGSRKHEVELILPEMVKAAAILQGYHFSVVPVSHLSADIYKDIIAGAKNITLANDTMHDVLKKSNAAVVTSGTATLETAITGTPQVVVYKGNPFSYQIARRLIKVPYISLVNLIAGITLVPELIQRECNGDNIANHLSEILQPEEQVRIKEGYENVVSQLTSGGGPEAAAADIISDLHMQEGHGKI